MKILLIDNHQLIRAGLKNWLDSIGGFQVIADVDDEKSALLFLSQATSIPDIILMDLKPSKVISSEVLPKMLHLYPGLKIIALTAQSDQTIPEIFIKLGGRGYLTKACNLKEISAAIQQVYAGKLYLSSDIAQHWMSRTLFTSDTKKRTAVHNLSKRESEVAQLLIKGWKIPQIALHLKLSEKTVQTYRYRIYEKLNVSNSVELMLLITKNTLVENMQ